MPEPICMKCKESMRCYKNGQAVVNGSGLWHGDAWKCSSCGAIVVLGFGRHPIAEPHDPNFQLHVQADAQYGTVITVED
jgi:hypothetical protein